MQPRRAPTEGGDSEPTYSGERRKRGATIAKCSVGLSAELACRAEGATLASRSKKATQLRGGKPGRRGLGYEHKYAITDLMLPDA